MSLKKKNETFADAANRIIKKYKRADFDPIEKRDLDAELASLSREQDQYKIDNGLVTNNQGQLWAGTTGNPFYRRGETGLPADTLSTLGFSTQIPQVDFLVDGRENPSFMRRGETGQLDQGMTTMGLNPAPINNNLSFYPSENWSDIYGYNPQAQYDYSDIYGDNFVDDTLTQQGDVSPKTTPVVIPTSKVRTRTPGGTNLTPMGNTLGLDALLTNMPNASAKLEKIDPLSTAANPVDRSFIESIYDSYNGLSNSSKTQIGSSLIGGLSSGIGNLIMMANKVDPFKPMTYRPAMVRPADVSYRDERDRAIARDNLNRNITSRQIQDAGGSAGQRMASIGYANAAANNKLNDALGRSYQRENEFNARAKQRASEVNQQAFNRGDMINNQRQMQYFQDLYRAKNDQNAYMGAMFNTLPSMMRDWNQIMDQDATRKLIGKYYRLDNNGNITFRGQ